MNEILAIIFLLFAVILPFSKKLMPIGFQLFFDKKINLKLIGLLALIIGGLLLYVVDFSWSDRIWKNTIFVFGVISILRGLVAIFFENLVYKFAEIFSNNYYKFSITLSVFFLGLALLMVSRDYLGPVKNIDDCVSDQLITIYCEFTNPEDIALLPDNEFLLLSEFGGIKPYEEKDGQGSFALLRLKDNKRINPKIIFSNNTWGDPKCTRTPDDGFGPHGIDLVTRADGSIQVGFVNHYPFESIEFFELNQNDAKWEMTWRGCVNTPEHNYFNDLSIRRDGTFYASHMYKRSITINEWLSAALFKYATGYVVKWDKESFTKVPNSDGSQPNGIGLDETNELLYINHNLGDKLEVVDLINNQVIGTYRINSPDNMIITDDSIWLTSLDHETLDALPCAESGSINCSLPFSIHEIDRVTLERKNLYSFQETVFGFPTTAYPINKTVYIGSFHSDRMASFTLD